MIASLIAGLALTVTATDFPGNPDQYSEWMQHACQVQQVGYNGGGVPADYVEFCSCLDGHLQETSSEPVYRVFALGSQGSLQDQSMIEDWEGARDTAAAEAGAMAPEVQGQFASLLQGALGHCFALSPSAN